MFIFTKYWHTIARFKAQSQANARFHKIRFPPKTVRCCCLAAPERDHGGDLRLRLPGPETSLQCWGGGPEVWPGGGGRDDQSEAPPHWQHHLLPPQLPQQRPVLHRQLHQSGPQHSSRSASVGVIIRSSSVLLQKLSSVPLTYWITWSRHTSRMSSGKHWWLQRRKSVDYVEGTWCCTSLVGSISTWTLWHLTL